MPHHRDMQLRRDIYIYICEVLLPMSRFLKLNEVLAITWHFLTAIDMEMVASASLAGNLTIEHIRTDRVWRDYLWTLWILYLVVCFDLRNALDGIVEAGHLCYNPDMREHPWCQSMMLSVPAS